MNSFGKYNKQQSEMIVFLGITALVLIVISYLFFIKPSFATANRCKGEMTKIEKEMTEEEKDVPKLKNLIAEQKKLTRHITEQEKNLLHGLSNNRLIPFFTAVVSQYDFPIEPSYQYEKSEDVPLSDCIEVFSRINIRSYDYLELGQFINALESSNPGIRISEMTLARTVDSTGPSGLVDAEFELRLLGFRQQSEQNEKWEPKPLVVFNAEGGRNPFCLFSPKVIADPEKRFLDELRRIEITLRWKEYGIVIKQPRDGKSVDWMLGESITLGEKKVVLKDFSVDLPQNYIIIERKDSNTSYRLATKNGKVRRIEPKELKKERGSK